MKKIIYVGNFSFPFGNASGKRVYGNGKVLEELGYDILFIGMNNDVKQTTTLKETEMTFQDFKYYNFSYPKGSLGWIGYKTTFNKMINFIEEENIKDNLEAVIYYGSPRLSLFNYLLIKWCQNNNIKIISDCVDWLTSKSGNIIFDLIKWTDTTYQKAYLNRKVDGVIVISSYLENYYKKYGLKTIVIPPLSTNICLEKDSIPNDDKKLKIIYAGIPFRKGRLIKDANTLKDRVDTTIILFSKIKEKGFDFIFDIYGFTKEEYLTVLPNQEKYIDILGDSISFHGYHDNTYIVEKLKKSDFTILLRNVKKDTMAGFPTKVSESMSYGIPVITTKTSDLEKYIIDGKNGFFLDIANEEKSIIKLEEIFKLKETNLNKMKNICIEENKFFFMNYKNDMKHFFNKLNVSN